VRHDHPRLEKADMPPLLPTLLNGLPALSLPVIILCGIVLGWMTPTEAAAVAVFAALGAGWFYSGLTWAGILAGLRRTATLSGSIFIIICAVSALGHLGALERLPEAISDTVTRWGLGPVGYMLAMNVIFLLAGMVLDIPVALALLVPLLAPVALEQGADPVHLGIVLCFNLCIGLVSPPMGGCLLVVSTVTGVNYWQLARAVIPFVLVQIAVLALLIAVPAISLALPRAFGLAGG
jgi:tripartite ATP-independent transporter DctM subunit